MFNNLRNDLAAYNGDWSAQGFWVMIIYRFGRWRYRIKPTWLRKVFSLLYKISFRFIQVLTGVELPCEVKIGRNFIIDHFGGIIISGYAQFGDNCGIRNGVVVGLAKIEDPCAPVIGNNVDIGSGSKLLGRIKVGNNVTVGANAVVVKDVEDGMVVAGIPAKVIGRTKTNECIK